MTHNKEYRSVYSTLSLVYVNPELLSFFYFLKSADLNLIWNLVHCIEFSVGLIFLINDTFQLKLLVLSFIGLMYLFQHASIIVAFL